MEVFNPTTQSISTTGYYFTDDPNTPTRWAFPATSAQVPAIPPGGFRILYLSGESAATRPQNDPHRFWHVPFKLKAAGQSVYLYRNSGAEQVDALLKPGASLWPAAPHNNVTWGRDMFGSGTSAFFEAMTPGTANDPWTAGMALPEPDFTDANTGGALPGRLYRALSDGPIRAAITHFWNGSPDEPVITYTLDGSEPTAASWIYREPIEIRGTAVLRARAFRSGFLPSRTISRTFIDIPSVPAEAVANPLRGGSTSADGIEIAASWAHDAPPFRAGYSALPILEQLEARPAIFITVGNPAAINPGGETEYPASFEFYLPGNPSRWSQEYCIMQKTGESGGGEGGGVIKKSWDIIFKDNSTLNGTDRWTGPVESNGLSAVFSECRVLEWKRLKLRNPSTDSFAFNRNNQYLPAVYLSDAWLKETQRNLGGYTAKRRWVHLWINGRFHGLYDLEEHHNADTISAWLTAEALAAEPNATPERILQIKDERKPERIEFLATSATGSATPNALTVYTAEVLTPCYNAAGTTFDADPQSPYSVQWAAVQAHLDVADYTKYITTLEFTGKDDHANNQFRAWRHPVTEKWHFIAWDGDTVFFSAALMNPLDRFLRDSITPLSDVTSFEYDRQPNEYLATRHPGYKAMFDATLQSAVAGPLGLGVLGTRFDDMAADVRSTLEAEAMRWGSITRLTEWSTNGPVVINGTARTNYAGIENHRRYITNTLTTFYDYPTIGIPPNYYHPSLRALLRRAQQAPLQFYSGIIE